MLSVFHRIQVSGLRRPLQDCWFYKRLGFIISLEKSTYDQFTEPPGRGNRTVAWGCVADSRSHQSLQKSTSHIHHHITICFFVCSHILLPNIQMVLITGEIFLLLQYLTTAHESTLCHIVWVAFSKGFFHPFLNNCLLSRWRLIMNNETWHDLLDYMQ